MSRLEQDFRTYLEGAGMRLPPATQLASEFGVSHARLLELLRRLRKEGLLDFTRGGSIRQCGERRPPLPESLPTASDRIYAHLRGRIETGEYPSGEPLPKLRFFTTGMKASFGTVTRAFRRLESESLVHRKGRRFLAGPPPAPSIHVLSLPVLLMVLDHNYAWRSYCRNPRVQRFPFAFQAEAVKAGVQLVVAYLRLFRNREVPAPAGPLHIGRESLRPLLQELGERHMGSLMLFRDPARQELGTWASALKAQGRPVVWLDDGDRRHLMPEKSGLVRAYYYEHDALEQAVRLLSENGHHRIAFVRAWGTAWEERREGILRSLTAREGMSFVSLPTLPEMFADRQELGWKELDALLRRRGQRGQREALARLGGQWPGGPPKSVALRISFRDTDPFQSMFHLIALMSAYRAQDEPTGFLLPNDAFARRVYEWTRLCALRPGRDLSLLSFDNTPDWVPIPVSTVDFGFEYLGHAVFHFFMGDIPVRKDSAGHIPSRARIIHRGSVGPVV